jgi:ATP-dependent Lon protease
VPCGVAFFVAMISAIQNRRIQAGTVILGDLTIQGNIKGQLRSLSRFTWSGGRCAASAGAAINKAQFAGLPEEVVES